MTYDEWGQAVRRLNDIDDWLQKVAGRLARVEQVAHEPVRLPLEEILQAQQRLEAQVAELYERLKRQGGAQ